jgi:hypothetical protein
LSHGARECQRNIAGYWRETAFALTNQGAHALFRAILGRLWFAGIFIFARTVT